MSSYETHFAMYCRGRTRVDQKVLSVVWKAAYKGYIKDQHEKEKSPDNDFVLEPLPKECTLQDALLSAPQDMGTGVADFNKKGFDEAIIV